ncbi:MAG: choice-of-anchor L domain-containing protein, partial [Flavobacteriales bacterium]|nr:choice-of-anchor L domain-containing protein [Flavobacteriales bacterium]
MKNSCAVILFFLLSVISEGVMAQLVVTTGQTAQQSAGIIAGPGVVVSNASITGDPSAIGRFTSGLTDPGLGLASGVVMASGDVALIPDVNSNFASTVLGTAGDPFLEDQANQVSNDAIILQFDFVPNADFVSFTYVFGSEEYPEWTCSFNDIFAFTIEGVSTLLPQTNIALVPGTSIVVSINSVSDDVGCMLSNGGQDNSAYYIDNTSGPASQFCVYDGLTVLMTAETPVLCGETYTLRLMLSDGGDSSYDSGCFIEENSLTTGNVTIQTSSLGGDTTAIEGCADLEIILTLNGDPVAQDYPVQIWIGGGSTATWGIDYDPINEIDLTDSTIVIPAGSNSISFTIVPINDNIAEGFETIDLVAITSTCGTIDTFPLYIIDLDPLVVTASNDTTICLGNALGWANTVGGGGNYAYTWNQGFGTIDTIYAPATVTTTYTVSVTDECGSTPATDSLVVTVDGGPVPFAGNDVSVCIGGSVLLNASSNTPGSTFEWTPTTDLSDPLIYNPLSIPQTDMEYIVRVTRIDGCYNDDTVNVTLTPPPTAEFVLPAVGCAGEPLLVNYAGNANASAQYLWDFDGGTITNGNGIGPIAVLWATPGIYDVDLTVSWNGCLSTNETNQIEIIGPPAVDAGADVTFCSGETVAIGSAPLAGVNYTWSPINGVADASASASTLQLASLGQDIEIIDYILMAEEQGCKNYDTVVVTLLPIPTAEFIVPEGKCFNVNSFNLDAQGFFGVDATFSWDFGAVGFPSTSDLEQPQGVIFNVPGPQNVTLVVEDNGCLSAPFIGTIDVYEMPVAAFESDVTEGCEMLPVNFQDLSYNGNSNLYYLWDMGNGSSATEPDPGNVYSAGSYSVHLAIETTEGCAD